MLSPGCLKILQLTDTHLFGAEDATLKDVNTRASLRAVLNEIRTQPWQPDIVLASGDLVHDESSTGYAVLIDMLKSLGRPIYALPGNHDNVDLMQACFKSSAIQLCGSVHNNRWHLIMLNSTVRGKAYGLLIEEELVRLDEILAGSFDTSVLICLHHHAVEVGSRWLDKIGLRNAESLFSVIDQYTHVRALLCGHIHQAYMGRRHDMLILGTPSTCFQFLPGSDEFAVDDQPPGYRQLELMPNGSIQTEVRRLVRDV